MSVKITKEDIIAYAEVDYIIKHMKQIYISKLPENLLNFFETMKDPDHKVDVNPFVPLQNQGLKQYTLEIIALLHVKYWCEDQERKQELLGMMKENQEKFEMQLKEKFNDSNLFNETETIENDKIGKDPIINVYENNSLQHSNDEENQSEELPKKVDEQKSLTQKIKLFLLKIFGKSTE